MSDTGGPVEESAIRTVVAEHLPTPITGVEFSPNATNAVYVLQTDSDRYVIKFNTFSNWRTFHAEPYILRFLATETSLTVPSVIAIDTAPVETPPFFIMEYLPGETPTNQTEDLARQMGANIRRFAELSPDAIEGYGRIEYDPDYNRLRTAHQTWRDHFRWYLDHVLSALCRPFTEYIGPFREHVDELAETVPERPEKAVTLMDYRYPNVRLNDRGDIVGTLDVERADIGDSHLMVVNAAYLVSRTADPARNETYANAVYDGFGEQPSEALRRCYRAAAVAREMRGFRFWWDADEIGETAYERHVHRVENELDEILASR